MIQKNHLALNMMYYEVLFAFSAEAGQVDKYRLTQGKRRDFLLGRIADGTCRSQSTGAFSLRAAPSSVTSAFPRRFAIYDGEV